MKQKICSSLNSDDIAKIAGVSRSTVSKVINGYADVSEDTRKKIMAIIKDCGYAPNQAARVLAGKNVETIGLFFFVQQDEPYCFSDDTIVDRMLASIADTASCSGYLTLTLIIRKIDNHSRAQIRDIFVQNKIDGGIFIGANSPEPIIEELVQKGFIVGVLDYQAEAKQEPNKIIVNYDPFAGSKAIMYLVKRGHSKIMAIHGDLKRYDGQCKFNSCMNEMKKQKLEIRNEWMIEAGFNPHKAYTLFSDFLDNQSELPSAIFCANDQLAYKILKALSERKIKVPQQIAVLGMDDALPSCHLTPSLSTFKVDYRSILRLLTTKLIEYITAPQEKPFIDSFESILIKRKSC